MEPTTKKIQKRKKNFQQKKGYAQKYQQTVRGIHGVSPEKEKKGYSGKDLQKRKVLSLERKE